MIDFPANDLVNGGASPMVRERGLRAPQAAPVHLCRHCGVPLANEAARAAGFCCAGCSYVFRLVEEHGLGGYYKIRDAVTVPVGDAVFQPRDFTWLALRQRELESQAEAPELILGVQGISCAGCVWLIEKLFHQQPGALQIETDAQLGRMRLQWEPGKFDAPAFARLLQSFNYLAGPPGAEPAVAESRRLVQRIGLAAACSMNVMLFTLPVYFGMEATFPYARLFGTLSLAFATLGLLTGGSYFLGRALAALRAGTIHIDLPIALGIVGAYLGSLFGWLSGQERFVYFDFVSAFILLMLVGRWAQVTAVERNRRRLLSGQAQLTTAGVLQTDGSVSERPLAEVKPGDILVIPAGGIVPVAAQLVSSAGVFGTAWISGETDPREDRAGAMVPAGARNIGRDPVELRAVQPWRDSLLAVLLRPAARDPYRHRFLERVISGYLIAILGIATLTAIGWWTATRDGIRTWSAVTAVLVVSCPCAIGLAFPLADEIAMAALRRRGVFVREADLWPRLARIRRIVFDKTGTLTLEAPLLLNPAILTALSGEEVTVLLALVQDSLHPVAQSLRQNILGAGLRRTPGGVHGVDKLYEEPGQGAWTLRNGIVWSLGRPGWRPDRAGHASKQTRETSHDTEFCRDGIVVASFRFADSLRPDAREEIDALQKKGFIVSILSGDRPTKVAAMAAALGLPPDEALGGLTPADKSEWLRTHDNRDTLMLGDGANDSLAFDAAFARGTPAVHGGVLETKADFYYLGQGVGGIGAMFAIDACRRRTHRWLLIFSVAYNLCAVGLAVAGYMNPLLAAILMPVSSLATLLIVAAGMRAANAAGS